MGAQQGGGGTGDGLGVFCGDQNSALRAGPEIQRAGRFRLFRARKLRPTRASVRAFHHGFDEDHAFNAVVDRREIQVLGLRPAPDFGADGAKRLLVNVAERLEVALGMSGGDAGEALGVGAVVAVAALSLNGVRLIIADFVRFGPGSGKSERSSDCPFSDFPRSRLWRLRLHGAAGEPD